MTKPGKVYPATCVDWFTRAISQLIVEKTINWRYVISNVGRR